MGLFIKQIGHVMLLLTLFTALSACNLRQTPTADAPQKVTSTETSAPATATESATPDATTRPTNTAEAPTVTPSHRPLTPTPSLTSRPPTDTPRSPTVTPTPLTPATISAATVTPASPIITSFTADVTEADPGDTITLSWATSGATRVTLYHMMPTGQFGRFWDVEPQGTFDYDIAPQERNRTSFVLAASDPADNYVQEGLSITLRCPDEWFFAGAPDICPAAAALNSPAAEQHFEGGTMIWVQVEDRIYVLFDSGQYAWQAYRDEWDPGEPESDPELTPPAGRYQPVRGFGQVWRQNSDVRDRLGWAVDRESAFTTHVQRTSYARYNETYLRALDGNIWKLLPERSDWEKIAP